MTDTFFSIGVGISTVLIIGTIMYFRSNSTISSTKGSKKIKKNTSSSSTKKLSLTEQYQNSLITIESNVKNTIEPEINSYYNKFENFPKEDRLYKFNYFQETLLKELIKLDGIDLTLVDNETIKKILKDERKIVIKHIQLLQKGLDGFKKENICKFPEN